MGIVRSSWLVAMIALTFTPPGVAAQSVAQRVGTVRTGSAELRFATRPGVCGDGRRSFSIGRMMRVGGVEIGDDLGSTPRCLPGPARVRLLVENGTIADVRVSVGPVPRPEPDVTDLGTVPSSAAADYFVALARTGMGRVTNGAITAAVLADSASVWRPLLAIANDSSTRSRSTRRNALFWVGRFAATKLEGHGEDIAALDDDDHDDPRGAAIFALSQLRNHQGVEPLVQVARTHRDPAMRARALFWLGESGDPRALDLFEDILRR
jgi:hypothetical protein